ncbi:MAG: hypothetical protein J6C41_06565 [Oscillospiraceae bacterium]|nr:hypothetical protein [Oscillospiraceae bacterium]
MDVRIQKSFQRLSNEPYASVNLFSPPEYDWPGDWEGRALLAYCRLYSLTGKKVPAMEQLMQQLPEKVNSQGYFGPALDLNEIDEQQLSGHGWFLRGLMAYYELFQSSKAMEIARQTVYNLFLPALANFAFYPVQRKYEDGGVYGSIAGKCGNWRLSTDIGCAFISLDGLAHYYAVTGDKNLEMPLAYAIWQFMKLDKRGLGMQTHATLTATRGILKYYEVSGEEDYLSYVQEVFDLYVQCGMTATYENYNWFGDQHEKTWTEPCAVVDSMILALELYRITKEDRYRVLARRIWFNGLQFCQRSSGGVGPNTCVDQKHPYLQISFYDAVQCCTMRYSEGLYWYQKNKGLFSWKDGEPVFEDGRYYVDDWLLVQDVSGTYPDEKCYELGDKKLIRLPLLHQFCEQEAMNVCLRVIF